MGALSTLAHANKNIEAIAELSHRPLYYIGVNELMSKWYDDAETVMRRVFDLATSWGAIILLDEADIFMVKRGGNNNHQDGLVAAFLRVLEYHEGIIFLTSNRVEDFDEAFESRLRLRLRYPSLDAEKKASIWRTALASVPETHDWPAADIQRLAEELDINGRQIANLVPTALAVSRYKKMPLTMESLIEIHKLNFGSG
jgi:SpoVK/Ycf46/Vps4 family AAA+-type ATPase